MRPPPRGRTYRGERWISSSWVPTVAHLFPAQVVVAPLNAGVGNSQWAVVAGAMGLTERRLSCRRAGGGWQTTLRAERQPTARASSLPTPETKSTTRSGADSPVLTATTSDI